MSSRRRFLRLAAPALALATAGCTGALGQSGEAGSSTVDCHTAAAAHGDGELLDGGATATVEEGDVRLQIPLVLDDMRATGVDRVEVYAGGDLRHEIPVDPSDADVAPEKRGQGDHSMVYEQYLGHRPLHGRYRIVAVDGEGSAIDSLTIEFNCFAEGVEGDA